MSTKYCAVCRSRTTGKFILVPRDESRRELWSRITGLKFSSSTKICEKHFKDSDFYYQFSTKATRRRRLMITAVPQKPEPKQWFTKHMPSTCRDNVLDSQTEYVYMSVNILWLLINLIKLQRRKLWLNFKSFDSNSERRQ